MDFETRLQHRRQIEKLSMPRAGMIPVNELRSALASLANPDCKQVSFSSLPVGATFFVWGDEFLNYESAYWCECRKTGEQTAQELYRHPNGGGGTRFSVDPDDGVFVSR